MTSLGELLAARGLPLANMVAIRNSLHPDDVSADFRSIDDLIGADALPMYDRMQDGPRIDHDASVLSFMALPDGHARLTGFRKFRLRRQGNVPGDIVYHYDAAHLLHSFIARAAVPCFYDAIDEDGLDDLIGRLVLQWPEPLARNLLGAGDAGLVVVALTRGPDEPTGPAYLSPNSSATID
jgi:hypothetical protein